MSGLVIRPARPVEAARLAEIAASAYAHYVDRIGARPRPMDDDYAMIITRGDAVVACLDGEVVGLIVASVDEDGHFVDNLAVDPRVQGQGVGRALIAHAEESARGTGAESIYLYTHELMHENIRLYESLGYVEFERRPIPGGSLVYLRKPLGSSASHA